MSKTRLSVVSSFECVVTKPENGWFGETTKKQTPYIRIPLEVTDPGSCEGHVITWSGWLSDAAFQKTIARLAEVFGFDGDLKSLHEGKVTLEGMPCNITTEEKTNPDNNKKTIEVAWLNSPGGGGKGAKAMDSDKLKSLLGKLNQKSKAIAKAAIATQATGGSSVKADPQKKSEEPQADPEDPDGVPF